MKEVFIQSRSLHAHLLYKLQDSRLLDVKLQAWCLHVHNGLGYSF
jgi:hypothetical protein